MTVLQGANESSGRRLAGAFAIATAATLALWGLSLLIERPAGWSPPRGAEVALYVHLFTVIPAVPLGAFVLWRPKGGRTHRVLGATWAAMMIITSISSFWLQTLSGGLSFIHLFSAATLVSIPIAIRHARRGDIRSHMNVMRGVYAGLIVAGLVAAMPGRFLGVLLFG